MNPIDIRLVCEGQPQGRDIRWLALALSELAGSFEPASTVRVVPGGSKADLGAAVRGLRETLGTRHVYAIRDRDFLPSKLLAKDVGHGVYSFNRHCLESYLVEPKTIEDALGADSVEARLLLLAERRFWPDVARAVLDAVGYEIRQPRLSLGSSAPDSKVEVMQTVTVMLGDFRQQLAELKLDVEELVNNFSRDMDVAPLWTRVNGKELMAQLEDELRSSVLPGGDIEGRLFRQCKLHGPPEPLVAEVRQILERMLAPNAPAPLGE